MTITSIRDPRTWLPSLFFEKNKKRYCDGGVGVEQAVGEFSAFIGRGEPSSKTAGRLHKGFIAPRVLEHFGVANVTQALEAVTANGVSGACFD
jgi:hypothetical protein